MSGLARPPDQPRLAAHSAIISVFTAAGVAAGLGLDVLVAGRYGLNAATDALFVAETLPVIILAGALSAGQSVLVVALRRALDAGSEHNNLLNGLATAAAGVGLALALIGTALSGWLMRALAPGQAAAATQLATQLSVILFWQAPAVAMAETLRADLYARGRMAAAAAGNFIPAALALGLAVTGAGRPVNWIAWALLGGSWAGLAWMVGAQRWASGEWIRPNFTLSHPALRQVGRELRMPLLGLLARQAVTLAERFFGSFLPAGSIAALGYANKITQVAAGVLFDSLNTASLPTLTSALARGDRALAHLVWGRLVRLASAAALGLGLGLALLSQLAAPRLGTWGLGALDAAALAELARVLTAYGLALIPLGPFRAVQTYFYAARQPQRVAALLAGLAATTIILDGPLSRRWGAAGLGAGLGVGALAALIIGWVWRRRLDSAERVPPPG